MYAQPPSGPAGSTGGAELTISAIAPVLKKQLTEEEKELLQIPGDPDRLPIVRKDFEGFDAFVLENVLSPKECEYLTLSCIAGYCLYWCDTFC